MGLVVGFYRMVVPISSILLMLIPIILGAISYIFLLLKLDTSIRSEVIQLGRQIGISWPQKT